MGRGAARSLRAAPQFDEKVDRAAPARRAAPVGING